MPKAGLVKLGNIAIDGTKIMANASRDRSASYKKLTEQEQSWKETISKLLSEAQQTDQQEDERWGKGEGPQDLPKELADAKRRLALSNTLKRNWKKRLKKSFSRRSRSLLQEE